MKDIYQDADNEQSKFSNKLKSIDKVIKSIEKKLLSDIGLFFTVREKVLKNFKTNFYQ